MEQNRVRGTVEWYDEKKGYGIGKPDDSDKVLYLSSQYFTNCDNLSENDKFLCTVIPVGKINHATKIEKVLIKNDDFNKYKK